MDLGKVDRLYRLPVLARGLQPMAFRGIYLPYVFSRPDLICLDVDAKGFLELCVVLTGTSKVTLGLFSHGFESRFASLSSVGLVVRGFLGTSIIRYLLSRL